MGPRGSAAPEKAAIFRAALVAAAAAAAVLLCLLTAACRPRPERPAYPYVADRPRVLFATAEGLSAKQPLPRAGAAATKSEDRQYGSHNASVVTSDGRSILAVVEGAGYARIEAASFDAKPRPLPRSGSAKDGVAYRIVNIPFDSNFAGLKAAGAWPSGESFVIQLYRDPFDAESGGGGLVAASIPLFRIDSSGAHAIDLPGIPDGYELFALFPSQGRWFGELRRDTKERVELSYFETDAPIGSSPAKVLSRAVFESALAPKSLFSLQGLEGAALRSGLAALGKGPWMLRYRSAAGEDGWYLSEGRPEDAKQAWAWSLGSGRVLTLSASGTLVDSGIRGTRKTELGSPCPGSVYTGLAAASGLVVAAWEAGVFPAIDKAGLVIAPLDR
jgi:hypothetical protein